MNDSLKTKNYIASHDQFCPFRTNFELSDVLNKNSVLRSKSVLCSLVTDSQIKKWLQRTPFKGFRNFSFNLLSRIKIPIMLENNVYLGYLDEKLASTCHLKRDIEPDLDYKTRPLPAATPLESDCCRRFPERIDNTMAHQQTLNYNMNMISFWSENAQRKGRLVKLFTNTSDLFYNATQYRVA